MREDDLGLGEYDTLGCLAVSTDGAERGLVLKQDLQPSETILLLPARSLINVQTLSGVLTPELLPTPGRPSHAYHWDDESLICREDDSEEHRQLRLPLTSVQALTLALAQWKSSRESHASHILPVPWNNVLESFPPEYPTLPLVWQEKAYIGGEREALSTKSLLNSLPTDVSLLCKKVRHRLQRDCRTICSIARCAPHLLVSQGQPFDMPSHNDLLWAWCSVNTRCVYVPLGLRPHLDNFTLAPLLDMANHTMDTNIECKVKWTPTGSLQLSAPAKKHQPDGLKIGQELFISYGPHSNGTLLSEYGFILASNEPQSSDKWCGNPFAEVKLDTLIETELQKRGDAGVQAKELLESYNYYGDYTIHPFPSPAHPSHRLVIALRLIVMSSHFHSSAHTREEDRSYAKRQKVNGIRKACDTDLTTWRQMVEGEREIVSNSNEDAIRHLLSRLCDEVQTSNQVKISNLPTHCTTSLSKCFSNCCSLIESLLREEIVIAQRLKDAIRSGSTDW